MRPLHRSWIVLLLLLSAGGPAEGAEGKTAAGGSAAGADAETAAVAKVRDKAALTEARDNVLRELKEHPKSLPHWKRLAMIQRHLEDEKGTEAALLQAAALDPTDPGVNFMQGLLHEKRAERVKAAASFRVCLENAVQEKIKGLCAKHLNRMEKP